MIANVAEIHSLSTLSEKEQCIELAEKLGRGLMNCDEDGLTDGGKLAKESDDENTGLGDKLDSNSDTLSLLDTQSRTNSPDQCIGKIMELEKINNCINILELLLAGNITALSKKGGKLECFADGGHAWLDPALDVVEKGTFSGGCFDGVRESSPGKDRGVADKAFGIGVIGVIFGDDAAIPAT
ncbi:hypothetical protein HG530_002000 [Fusarium avenaceum]|nr:hypothetical protein HG530_002000 [Fusarium avenaceum]